MPLQRGPETGINGLLTFELDTLPDPRGSFSEKYNHEDASRLELPVGFVPVQTNVSSNVRKGVTRGIHAEPWNKYITVFFGRAFAAFVDLRLDSETFGEVHTTELNPSNAVFVPEGVGNSYQTLSGLCIYGYQVDAHWSPDAVYDMVNLADPDLNIDWPIKIEQTLKNFEGNVSEKDLNHPTFAEWKELKNA